MNEYTPSGPLNNFGFGANIPSGQDIVQNHSEDLTYLLQTQDSPEAAAEWLRINNPELYYQLILERDNNRIEWERYADYQKNYYSIQKESLKKAGLNPWLALSNFGSIGTGSVGNIQGMNSGSSTLKAQRESKSADIGGKAIGAAGAIIGAILGAIIMAML